MPESTRNEQIETIIAGILKFHEALVGHAFYTYQYLFSHRIIEALFTDDDTGDIGSTITGLWSRQSGKSSAVAELIVTLAILLPVLAKKLSHLDFLQKFVDGLKVGIFAPIEPQAKISYDKMRDLLNSERCKEIMADTEIGVEITVSRGDQFSFSNDSMVVAKTASPDSSVEGISGLHIILIDEAQGVDPFKVEKEIEPMRASTNGLMVKIGTASVTRGGFRTDIEANIALQRTKGIRNHFQFDYLQVIAEKRKAYRQTGKKIHLAYERYVEGQKRRLGGEKSAAFRMNFMLLWQEARMDAVSDDAIEHMKDESRQLNGEGTALEFGDTWMRVAGLDIGKGVQDPSVCIINEFNTDNPIQIRDDTTGEMVNYYHHHFIAIREFDGLYEDATGKEGQYTRIIDFLRHWHVRGVTIDATSQGDPIWQRLQVLAPDIEWTPYVYNLHKKSDLFTYYLNEIDSSRIHLASGGNSKDLTEWKKFIDEHKTLVKEFPSKDSKIIRVHAPEPKNQLAKLPGQAREFHDDYPNSAALATWATKAELLQEMQVDQPQDYTGRGSGYGRQHRYARRH